ncbi:MAG TPA: serine protease [Stellaceae bacterium]|nr:serine protease [Stellaceae bacterium]
MSTHWRLSWLLSLALVPSATLGAGNDTVSAGDASSTVVWCYDRERDVVLRDVASACHGSIVSDAEAEAIKERREEAVAHALAPRPSSPNPEGLHFASLGTAFYVNEEGVLLTNHHVVADCKAVRVRSFGAPVADASPLAVDIVHDLALLRTEARPPAHAVFRSRSNGGDARDVATVGYPNEGLPALEPQETVGRLLRADNGAGRMLFSIDFRHGNSGGPILDSDGLVIGVVQAKINTPAVYARTGREIDDTGIGIPVSVVSEFLGRNHVPFQSSAEGRSQTTAQILAEARTFVARAECWR